MGTNEAAPAVRAFEIRIARFADGSSEVVTVKAVNRASAWSIAAAQVNDPNNIMQMQMLKDDGRILRSGIELPDGEPDFYGGVTIDEHVERSHAPKIFADSWIPGDVRGIDPESRLYLFTFEMFTEVAADTFAYARNRTEAWSISAFQEAVGQISSLTLVGVGKTRVGHQPDWSDPDAGGRVMWNGEQMDVYGHIPYGGVTVDLIESEMSVDTDSLVKMRQRVEEELRLAYEQTLADIPNRVSIVLDAGRGLGRLIAELVAREGVRVVIVGPRQTDLDTAAEEIRRETGSMVLPIAADVDRSDQVRAMAERVRARFGRIDSVFHVIRLGECASDEHVMWLQDRLQREIDSARVWAASGARYFYDSEATQLEEWNVTHEFADDQSLRRTLSNSVRYGTAQGIFAIVLKRATSEECDGQSTRE